MISLSEFNKNINDKGYVIFERFIDVSLVNDLLSDLESAYGQCRKIQLKNGIENAENTAHHLIGQGDSFMECLSRFEKMNNYLEAFFGGKYILNSFGGNLLKNGESYANAVHRDQRTYSDNFNLMLNTIIPLDDFSEENGATWLMDKGHEFPSKPTQSVFDIYKFQLTAPAGSLIMFNSNCWHQAGQNKTDKPRRSITPLFSRAFMKQGYDYPRALGYEYGHAYSEYLQQVLGYKSRTPSDLSQWYQKKDSRYYMDGQG